MALHTAYKQFLAAPNPSFLADNASLHYITTLDTFNGALGIMKHLGAQGHELKKVEEKFLDVVEGSNSLAVETHTTIEFLSGGGSYLPSLDDNFLADRTVTFPIIHIVSFDANGKILQIRQAWDQGSLLKLIDVIGKTGRNWPIHDGKDQIKLITSSVKSAGRVTIDSTPDEPVNKSRNHSNNVTRDPHASLSLFAPRQKDFQDSLPAVVAPRASARPAPRDYAELFVGNDDSDQSSTFQARDPRDRSESPSKPLATKVGAGKNFTPSRLFEHDETSLIRPTANKERSAGHSLKANPAKYQHFDFADGTDPKDQQHDPRPTPLKNGTSKHGSQWDFDDFNTPGKVVPSKLLRTNDVRHWGNTEDESMDSPIKFKKLDKPRKDAETHFEFKDDGTPEPRLIGRPRGAGQNIALGLYNDHLFNEEDGARPKEARTLNTIANVKDRRKDFEPHFAMQDESPGGAKQVFQGGLRDDRAKAVKMMDSNWDAYDESPNQKENTDLPTSPTRPNATKRPLSDTTNALNNRNDQLKGITIAGDGMGSRKGAESANVKARGINIGGDGMGGKKGAGRQWGFGDESDGQESGHNKPSKFMNGKPGKAQATGGDFWDF